MDREQRRLRYLEAMGIPVWVPRFSPPGTEAVVAPAAETLDAPAAGDAVEFGAMTAPLTAAPDGRASDAPGAMEWERSNELPPPFEPATPPARAVASLNWEALETCVRECTACALHRTRSQTVFGVGNRAASWMVIGEAPGEQEDLKGEPFVGRAGQLLNEMLRAVGLSRESVYIANILKCRPPQNRDPQAEETAACEDFLKRQLALIKPVIILAVGRVAAQNLLKTDTPIGKLRGVVHRYAETPLVVTYHPAYLLRSPLEKRKAWDDLQLALRTFRESSPLIAP